MGDGQNPCESNSGSYSLHLSPSSLEPTTCQLGPEGSLLPTADAWPEVITPSWAQPFLVTASRLWDLGGSWPRGVLGHRVGRLCRIPEEVS